MHWSPYKNKFKNIIDAYRNREPGEDIIEIEQTFGSTDQVKVQAEQQAKKYSDKTVNKKSETNEGSQILNYEGRTTFMIGKYSTTPFLVVKLVYIGIILLSALISGLVWIIFDARPIELVQGTFIVFSLGLSVIVIPQITLKTTLNESKKDDPDIENREHDMEDIMPSSNEVFPILRKDQELEVPLSEVMTGDQIKIMAGMIMPAHCLLLKGEGVSVSEEAITQDSREIKKLTFESCKLKAQEKSDQEDHKSEEPLQSNQRETTSPIILAGSQIQTGEGYALVLDFADDSGEQQPGTVKAESSPKDSQQGAFHQLSKYVFYCCCICAGVTLAILVLRFIIEEAVRGFEFSSRIDNYIEEWYRYILIALSIIVFVILRDFSVKAIREIALLIPKMLKDLVFVKNIASIEKMQKVTEVLVDKTGAITKNELGVAQFWVGKSQNLSPSRWSYKLDSYFSSNKHGNLLLQGWACNTTGTTEESNATEKAILKMIEAFGCDYEQLREEHLGESFTRFNFTSRRKKMSTILNNIKDNEYGYDKRLHTKGATEIILSQCTHYLDEDGNSQPMTPEKKNDLINNVIDEYAKNGMRTICWAYRDLKPDEGGKDHDEDAPDGVNKAVEASLTWVWILGIRDTLRPEAEDAIHRLQEHGVNVRIVSGDNRVTCNAIAEEVGIISKDQDNSEEFIMEGPEFTQRISNEENEEINLDEFVKIKKKLKVLGRSRPEDKYKLVAALQKTGEVVAVAGDGTNDAPALKKADVGIAMGITGTDVAKAASDIILLDDNIASIAKAHFWASTIPQNIRRFVQAQLVLNLSILSILVVGSIFLREQPLKPVHLLWVTFIVDFLSIVAQFGDRIMKLDSNPAGSGYITQKVIKHTFIMVLFQTLVILLLIWLGEFMIPEDDDYYPNTDGEFVYPGRAYTWSRTELYKRVPKTDHGQEPSRHYTVVFNTFVFMQIFAGFCARTMNDELNIFREIHQRVLFLASIAGVIVVHFVMTQWTQDIFQVARKGLHWSQWLFSIGVALSVFIVNLLTKLVPDKVFPDLFNSKKTNQVHNEEGRIDKTEEVSERDRFFVNNNGNNE